MAKKQPAQQSKLFAWKVDIDFLPRNPNRPNDSDDETRYGRVVRVVCSSIHDVSTVALAAFQSQDYHLDCDLIPKEHFSDISILKIERLFEVDAIS